MHEIDVFGQRLAQGARHRLDTTISDETPTNLRFDQLTQHLHARAELLPEEPLPERVVGDIPAFARPSHQARRELVDVELPERAIQVVRAPDRTAGLHARVLRDRHRREVPQRVPVHAQQCLEEHLRELFTRELAASTRAARVLARGFEQAFRPVGQLVFAVDPGRVQGEVDVEDGFERLPVVMVLDQRGAERGLEGVAVLKVDVLDRAHGVEVLGHRDRQARVAELVDEPLQHVEHGRA